MTLDEIRRIRAAWKADVARNGPFAYGTVIEQYPLDGRLCPRCEAPVTWDGPRRWLCSECGAQPPPDEQPGGDHA